jgi:hypothetical protein
MPLYHCSAASAATAFASTTPVPATATSGRRRIGAPTTGELEKSQGPYEDLEAFLHRADDLAESLIAEGYTGMKIWPFDHAAEAAAGNDISPPT